MKFLCPALALFLAVFFLAPSQSFAEYDKEMQYLHMYFSEDEFVVSPTRALKPLSEVAENIFIVTAEDIKNMNAHTLLDVLDKVPGIFVSFQGHDFGGTGLIKIQGSNENHVLVMVDGVRWNFIADGNAVTGTIPVGIIKRIEIIKGPASSSWGSSLGGVINILTKDKGYAADPEATVSASYGERNTQDYAADVSGQAGTTDYYLFVGRQSTDGLRNNRTYDNDLLYSKFNMPISSDSNLTFTAGYSKPNNDFGFTAYSATAETRAFFVTASFVSDISDQLSFESSLYWYENKFTYDLRDSVDGSQIAGFVTDEKTVSGNGKLLLTHDRHSVVFGVDASNGNTKQTPTDYDYEITNWALFANDTIIFEKLSVTPGIRYDHFNNSDSFISPSIGITYKLSDRSLLRGSLARGFTEALPAYIYGGGHNMDPNPDLKPENVWSYQVGIDSRIPDFLRYSVMFFQHKQKDAQEKVNDMFVNVGNIDREGIEVELETAPVFNTSLKTAFAYAQKNTLYSDDPEEEKYAVKVIVAYDDRKAFLSQLAGSYMWWDPDHNSKGESGMLWDLNLRKKVYLINKVKTEFFLSVHNIFNDSEYFHTLYENPDRWIEGGVRLNF